MYGILSFVKHKKRYLKKSSWVQTIIDPIDFHFMEDFFS